MFWKKAILSMLLICPLAAWGQLLSVTATLTDSDSTVWINGTCSVSVVSPNGAPFFNGTAVPTGPQTCAINGSGVLSTSIYNTSTITPGSATYSFNICSATSAPCSSFNTAVTAANMTTTLSGLLTAPRFSSYIPFAYGYADVEAISASGKPNGQYYNTTSSALRVWSGSAWTSAGGGGSGAPNPGVLNALYKSNGTGGWTQSAFSDNGSTSAASSLPFSASYFSTPSGGYYGPAGGIDPGAIGFTFAGGAGNNGIGFMGLLGDPSLGNKTLFILAPLAGGFTFGINDGTSFGQVQPLAITATALTTPVGVLPSINAAATVSQAVCVKAAGPPIVIGTCSTVVGSGGACTCN